MYRLIKFLLIALVMLSCSSKQTKHDAVSTSENEWPGMDSFHMIMAETFHPYMDSTNLQPIKQQAEELKKEAIKWGEAPLPEKVNSERVKKDLLELKTKASTLADLTKTGSDEAIGNALTELHDLFHKLQEAWYSAGKESSHEHH